MIKKSPIYVKFLILSLLLLTSCVSGCVTINNKTPDSEEIRSARRMFTDAMREMADAGKLDLQEVNTKFAQSNSETQSGQV